MRSNRNTARSKAMLRKAYMELALLDVKITVSSVCKRAGLSRNTMYAHYPSVMALANDTWCAFERKIDRCAEQTWGQQKQGSLHLLLLYYARFIQEEELYLRALARTQWYGDFIRKLEEAFVQFVFSNNKKMKQDTTFEMTAYVVAGGMMELYTKYLQNKLDVPLQQINDRIMRLYDEEIGKLKDQPDSLDVVQTDCTDDG